MAEKQNTVNLRQGRPERKEVRDHVPFKSNLGMIDRWLMGREGKSTVKVIETQQITASNHKEISIGSKVTMSAPIWKTYTILLALVDSKTDVVKRGMKKTIAEEYLGITARSFQQHLNVLYELCLVEFEEKVLNKDIVTDILVYPYPHYADTQACYLERHRNVEERDGLGVQLSKLGLEAKRKKEAEKKISQAKNDDPEKKISQGPEKKISQGPEKKISHSKVLMSQSTYVPKEEEEEEEVITLEDVTSFLNTQIQKREITNQKTKTAIYEVAEKCRAIGTGDIESMENYCIIVVEEKMKLFGQKQGKQSRKSKPIRTELLPDWFNKTENKEGAPAKENKEEKTEGQKEIEELMEKLRS